MFAMFEPDTCVGRLQELVALGLDRLVITGPSFGAVREDAAVHHRLFVNDVLPALHADARNGARSARM